MVWGRSGRAFAALDLTGYEIFFRTSLSLDALYGVSTFHLAGVKTAGFGHVFGGGATTTIVIGSLTAIAVGKSSFSLPDAEGEANEKIST